MPIKGIKKQEKFVKLCQQLDGFEKGKHQVVVPDIDKSHYSVIDHNRQQITQLHHKGVSL